MSDTTKAIWSLLAFTLLVFGNLLAAAVLIDFGLDGAKALGLGEVTFPEAAAIATGVAGVGHALRLTERDRSPAVVINNNKEPHE